MALASDKFVFLHIPKTGGMWASSVLRKVSLTFMLGHQHSHFPQLLEFNAEDWYNERFIFTIVRHPITWYQSVWAFRMKSGWKMNHPLDANCASNDFHTFVSNVLSYKPDGWVTWLYDQYIQYVPNGIDFVAKIENGSRDLKTALSMTNIKYDENIIDNLPRINDSDMDGKSSKHWAKYTPELFDRVMAVESKAISRYYGNYDINPNDHVGPRPW